MLRTLPFWVRSGEISPAHTVGGKSGPSCWRNTALDKRRVLMQQWANFCDGRDGERGKVVTFDTLRQRHEEAMQQPL
jgi:hypothetical protein